MRGTRLVWLLAAGWTLSGVAFAQPDAAAAGMLFDKGLADMRAQRYATGCPAIAESHRLDPRPGTLFTLAVCEASWGKTASAMAHFDDYLSLYERLPIEQKQRQRGRDKVAAQQRDELRRKVPWLTVKVPASAPADVVVKRDGELLGAPSIGVALPVDPGVHTLTAEDADGSKSIEVTLRDADHVEIEAELPPRKPKPVHHAVALATPQAEEKSSSAPVWGWSLVAIGVASLVGGSVTGGLVFGQKSTIDLHCPNAQCDALGESAVSTARALATASEVTLGLGGALLVAGAVVLFVASGHKPRSAMAFSPTGVAFRW